MRDETVAVHTRLWRSIEVVLDGPSSSKLSGGERQQLRDACKADQVTLEVWVRLCRERPEELDLKTRAKERFDSAFAHLSRLQEVLGERQGRRLQPRQPRTAHKRR